MFNPLRPNEIVTGVGRTAQAAAASTGALDAFERGQLLSAYSATRHLAVELEYYSGAIESFTARLARELRAVPAGPLGDAARAIEHCHDGPSLGDALTELLSALRGRKDAEARRLRGLLHRELSELARIEVQLLAEHID
jgi:hypothetical protein